MNSLKTRKDQEDMIDLILHTAYLHVLGPPPPREEKLVTAGVDRYRRMVCFGWVSQSSSSLLVLISFAHAADGSRGTFGRRWRRGSRHGPAGRRRGRARWREIPGRTTARRTVRRERLDHTTTALLKHLLLRKRDDLRVRIEDSGSQLCNYI